METKSIGIFVGSLRKGAYSKSTANYIGQALARHYQVVFVEMGNLLLFNQDYDDEGTTPAQWVAFRSQVGQLDACLFVTPEYNRSMPAVLKNALDIGSRPYGCNLWDGKPAAVVGVSPGRIGGAMGVGALRVPLAFLNLRLMMQPEVYLSDAAELFNEQGELTNASTAKFLDRFVDAFERWIG
ncbi:MAG: NAD(P)H-dependent oxidoreductase [Prevotellaceae bacterium]|jgi:chromate reductase|nr:NAD(P)H-dependent oxidoreductase [Prevotellaceae bacterium]